MNYNTKEPKLRKITCRKCNKEKRPFTENICHDCFWNYTSMTIPEKKTRKPDPVPSGPGGSVYFIQTGKHGPIKIGLSIDVRDRLEKLQVGNSEKLYLLGTMPNMHGKYDIKRGQWISSLERRLQIKFSNLNIRGEWYKPEEPLLSFISKTLL